MAPLPAVQGFEEYPGETAHYTLALTNKGNGPDTFVFTAERSWSMMLDPAEPGSPGSGFEEE